MNTPTKEPTETQRALASRMQHLLTAGHPKHVESGALRLIVEHDAQLTARAEAAESLVAEKDKTLEFIRDECDWDEGGDHWVKAGDKRIGPVCTKALAQTPASMVSKLAELKGNESVIQLIENMAARALGEEAAPRVAIEGVGALVTRIAEQDAELARLRESDKLHFGILQECHHMVCSSGESHGLIPDKIALLQQCHISEKRAKEERGELLAQVEQRAERLADALRQYVAWHGPSIEGHEDDADPVKDAEPLRIDALVNAALADQPAQANTQLAALIAALEVADRHYMSHGSLPDSPNDKDHQIIRAALAAAKQGARPVEKKAETPDEKLARRLVEVRREYGSLAAFFDAARKTEGAS